MVLEFVRSSTGIEMLLLRTHVMMYNSNNCSPLADLPSILLKSLNHNMHRSFGFRSNVTLDGKQCWFIGWKTLRDRARTRGVEPHSSSSSLDHLSSLHVSYGSIMQNDSLSCLSVGAYACSISRVRFKVGILIPLRLNDRSPTNRFKQSYKVILYKRMYTVS